MTWSVVGQPGHSGSPVAKAATGTGVVPGRRNPGGSKRESVSSQGLMFGQGSFDTEAGPL
jgi:hypothetical protein